MLRLGFAPQRGLVYSGCGGLMEGFTLVLLIGWLLLVGTFVSMFFMDKATKEAQERRAAADKQASEKGR
jgi:Tfp pilus assembly protein PilW